MATATDNKEFVREFVEQVLGPGNLDRLDEYLTEDYVEHNPAVPQHVEGLEATREYYAGIHEAFSDFEVTIQDLIAEDDKVA